MVPRDATARGAAPGPMEVTPGWASQAACVGIDPRVFFTNNPGPAKRVCARCPVADDCLADVLATESDTLTDRHGIRGGMTPRERHHFAQVLREVA